MIDLVGKLPPLSVKAQVWEVDGVPKAIAGYFLGREVPFFFSNIAEDVDVPKITIWRYAKEFVKELEDGALCNTDNEQSAAFLERLGWTHVETTESGEIYQWHK